MNAISRIEMLRTIQFILDEMSDDEIYNLYVSMQTNQAESELFEETF